MVIVSDNGNKKEEEEDKYTQHSFRRVTYALVRSIPHALKDTVERNISKHKTNHHHGYIDSSRLGVQSTRKTGITNTSPAHSCPNGSCKCSSGSGEHLLQNN
jgi:hypothetical protein